MSRERQPLSGILQQELTRAEFLKLIGVAIVSVFGIANVINNLTQTSQVVRDRTPTARIARRGFGSRTFGE